MTLRSKSVVSARITEKSLSDFAVGRKVDGRVKRIEEYGVFISIDSTKLSGLCHKSEVRMLVFQSSIGLKGFL